MVFKIEFTKTRAFRILEELNQLEERITLPSRLAEFRNELSMKITES